MQTFAADEIAPRAATIDHDNLFPADLWKKRGDLGLHGLTVSEEYGGFLAHRGAWSLPAWFSACTTGWSRLACAGTWWVYARDRPITGRNKWRWSHASIRWRSFGTAVFADH